MKSAERACAAIGTERTERSDSERPSSARVVHVADLDVLFAPRRPRCDGCDGPVEPDGDAAHDEPASGPVAGALLWRRGDAAELEPRPLCGACAAAIGLTALRQWEIEEEEG